MNVESRAICKFNLQGRCRFGHRCWNLHQNPRSEYHPKKLEKSPAEKVVPEKHKAHFNRFECSNKPSLVNKPKENITNTYSDNFRLKTVRFQQKPKYIDDQEEGACSLASTSLKDMFGPRTSTVEEALHLVKKAQSIEKVCGICFDTVLKKSTAYEKTFGLLPNCNHCFCMPCIKTWRQSKEFDLTVSKACPECRILSDFVFPSKIWLESKEDKDNFIASQRDRMKKLPCKFFRKGKGECPFGNTCLYQHALPNGKVLDVGPPSNRRRRSLFLGSDFFLSDDDDDDDDEFDDEYDEDDDRDIDFGWDENMYLNVDLQELMEYCHEHFDEYCEDEDEDEDLLL